jgi:methyl-accepting chemotaxis protein WspA
MTGRWQFMDHITITTRLVFWFFIIALVPVIALTLITHFLSVRSLELTARRQLTSVLDAKAEKLEDLIRERRHNALLIGQIPKVTEALTGLGEVLQKGSLNSPAYLERVQTYRPVLTTISETLGFVNLYLFDMQGKMLLRLSPELSLGDNLLTGPLKESQLAQVFHRAGKLLQAVATDYDVYTGLKEPAIFVASPVLRSGLLLGIVVVQLSNKEFYQVFSNYNGLGSTGETLVGIYSEGEVRFVAPLRYDPNAAFRRRVQLGSDRSTAMQKATTGGRGFGEALDYRGVQSLAAWTYLPSFRWGLQVKQDKVEAFALVSQQRTAVLTLVGSTGLLVLLGAILLAQAIARPLRGTATVARRIATDHLASRMSEYRTSTMQAAAAVNEISATSQELLRTMNEVNQLARQTSQMATTGQESLGGMDRTMRQLAESTGSIGSKLSVISERAANINLVVTTITKVADQTNLLSINAAIEAEKAGEYGLGFLVVAREIRRLADQTAVATLDIERMVKEMQYSVSAGVMEMDKFSEQVRQVVSEVQHIGGQLGQIIGAVQGLDQRFDQVTEGMRVQSLGADQIREAMTSINEVASKTSDSLRELNATIDRLSEAIGYKKDSDGHVTTDLQSSREPVRG